MINTALIIKSLPLLLRGAGVSLFISITSLTIGLVLGTILALLIHYSSGVIKRITQALVLVLRGTPMLVQIVLFFYMLPLIGISLPALWCAIVAIGVVSSAYICEIVRAGIQSVSRQQIEAAQTLGLSRSDTIRFIVLPQAFKTILPSLGNEAITLIKDSSLASLIGVHELYKEAQTIMNITYDFVTMLTAVAVLYLAMTSIAAFVLHRLELWMIPHAADTESH